MAGHSLNGLSPTSRSGVELVLSVPVVLCGQATSLLPGARSRWSIVVLNTRGRDQPGTGAAFTGCCAMPGVMHHRSGPRIDFSAHFGGGGRLFRRLA